MGKAITSAVKRVARVTRTPKPAGRAASAKAAPVAESPASVPADAAELTASNWSFDGVVRRVLGFSRAAEIEQGSADAESARAPFRATRSEITDRRSAFDALNVFVRSLDQETRTKLEVVIRAGREAETLPEAFASVLRDQLARGDVAPDLFLDGMVALQHLQRGHAVACATGFDLELDVARWKSVRVRDSLDERVWLRFGRELAQSTVAEWSCLALVDGGEQVERLYLRRGRMCWYSFDFVIDRPSDRQLALRRSERPTKNSKLVTLTLEAVVGRRCRPERTAVRRAALAMSARLGTCRMKSDVSSAKA